MATRRPSSVHQRPRSAESCPIGGREPHAAARCADGADPSLCRLAGCGTMAQDRTFETGHWEDPGDRGDEAGGRDRQRPGSADPFHGLLCQMERREPPMIVQACLNGTDCTATIRGCPLGDPIYFRGDAAFAKPDCTSCSRLRVSARHPPAGQLSPAGSGSGPADPARRPATEQAAGVLRQLHRVSVTPVGQALEDASMLGLDLGAHRHMSLDAAWRVRYFLN